jgi:hypothetical protein
MKKRLLIPAAIVFGIIFTITGVANADPRPVAASTQQDDGFTNAVWYYHSTWANENACRSTGKNMVAQGLARAYFCEFHDHPQIPTWWLYVLD